MNRPNIKKVPETDEDYILLYAEEMKKNPKIFHQQKVLIDSQIISSQSFFQNLFKGKDFKTEARKYLKARGII
jgi:hypothetical protein